MSSRQADDSAIGDADHGINMARGMTAVINKLDDNHQAHANDAVTGLRRAHQARCCRGNVAEGVVTPRLASGRPLGELQRFSGVIGRVPLGTGLPC